MLALNAAIEAVRAGEMGRGFSIVADSSSNTRERGEQILGMIKQMEDLVKRGIICWTGNCNNISHKTGCKEGRRSRNVPPVSCIFPQYSP
ncbi:MAG: hypothetical protein HDR06_03620 [Lachnospiraceae bacterium]|nr:hypothetical protein [Lachnospiraceae bacterium]